MVTVSQASEADFPVTFSGIVLPTKWDHQGHVNEMEIRPATRYYDTEGLLVSPTRLHRALALRLFQKVRVSGRIQRDASGRRYIHLRSIHPA